MRKIQKSSKSNRTGSLFKIDAGSVFGSRPHCFEVYPAKNASYQLSTDQRERLFLEVAGGRNAIRFGGDEITRFLRPQCKPKELIDRVQIYRQRIDFAVHHGFHAMIYGMNSPKSFR